MCCHALSSAINLTYSIAYFRPYIHNISHEFLVQHQLFGRVIRHIIYIQFILTDMGLYIA